MNKILNNRLAANISFIIALLSKFLLFFNNRIVGGDKIMQVAGAMNILKGKGYTLSVVSAQDFIKIENAKINEWPPLYSYLLTPLLKITGLNIEASCYLAEMISFTILLFFFYRLIKQLEFPYIVQFFLLLYLAFFSKPYFTSSFPTDILAVGFLLAWVSFFLAYLRKPEKKQLFFMLVVIVACAYTRYMYIPVIFIFPLLLIWGSYWQKKRTPLIAGITVFLICLLALLPLMITDYWATANLNSHWSRGFYPKNLLFLSPVIWDTLIDRDFYVYQFNSITSIGYGNIVNALMISNYFILAALTGYFLKKIFSTREILVTTNTRKSFFVSGGLISIGIIFLLLYTSLFNNLDTAKFGNDFYWTYVAESRYFIFLHFYLLIGIAYLAFVSVNHNIIIDKILKGVLLIIFAIEVSHGIWLLAKSTTKDRQDSAVVKTVAKRNKLMDNLIAQSVEQKYEPVFFLSYNYYFMAYCSLKGVKLCTDYENFDENQLRFDKPTQLIFMTRSSAARTYYQSFILKHQFSLIQRLDSLVVYSKYIIPSH